MTFDTLLAEIQTATLTLKPRQPNGQLNGPALHHIWQAFQAIQSMAFLHAFDEVEAFTGHIQELIVQVRAGAVPITDHFPSVILAAGAQIKLLLNAAQGGPPVDLNLQAALLETVFQMVESTVANSKAHELEGEATLQDAIVLPSAERVSAC